MSTAGQVDLALDQGADFGIQVYWVDADTNPFTVLSPMRMDIKNEVGAIIYSLQTDDLADPDNPPTILYNSLSGLIQLTIPAADTALFPPGIFRYDLWITYQDNAVTNTTRLRKLIEGALYVNGRVTTSV